MMRAYRCLPPGASVRSRLARRCFLAASRASSAVSGGGRRFRWFLATHGSRSAASSSRTFCHFPALPGIVALLGGDFARRARSRFAGGARPPITARDICGSEASLKLGLACTLIRPRALAAAAAYIVHALAGPASARLPFPDFPRGRARLPLRHGRGA